MGHGLCMIDRSGTLAIANGRLNQLLGVPDEVFQAGRKVSEALRACARAGLVERGRVRSCFAELRAQISSDAPEAILLPIKGGRILMITSRRMLDGSSVILVEDVTVQKAAEARISRLAHYDSLTDLPNRVSFRDEVTRLLANTAEERSCALLFVDLDEFKQVNDTLGHPSGDELLKQVAARLRAIVGERQLIARLGGDEFVVLLAPLSDPAGAAAVAQRIVHDVSVPYQVDGHIIIIGASVGIALAPADAADADTLLKNADLALYRAKFDGRGCFRFFEVEMDLMMREKRALETDLRHALKGGEFAVHYQPMINLKTGGIAGCEALIRWFHPQRGPVPPGEFIPMAEEMGLVVEIGEWVLLTACREATHWPAETRISVNLSPAQFRHGGLVETVSRALATSGLPPHRLVLEITESTLLRDTDAVLNTLNDIRALGASIALDDFGTGYSSLSYLRKFPLQAVKIDRSFLVGIETNRKQKILLRGIARLCGELGVKVVIEGVETSDQLDVIASNPEIEFAQGYMFAKPAAAVHVRRLMEFGFTSDAAGPEVAGSHGMRAAKL
jgi:diguanylate cyclase (GGDEF)-like protein